MKISLEVNDESYILGLAFTAVLITLIITISGSLLVYNTYCKYVDSQPKVMIRAAAPAAIAAQKDAEKQ